MESERWNMRMEHTLLLLLPLLLNGPTRLKNGRQHWSSSSSKSRSTVSPQALFHHGFMVHRVISPKAGPWRRCECEYMYLEMHLCALWPKYLMTCSTALMPRPPTAAKSPRLSLALCNMLAGNSNTPLVHFPVKRNANRPLQHSRLYQPPNRIFLITFLQLYSASPPPFLLLFCLLFADNPVLAWSPVWPAWSAGRSHSLYHIRSI